MNLYLLGFNTLIAIQSSAFLMTLYRKNIIKYYHHFFWYALFNYFEYLFHFLFIVFNMTLLYPYLTFLCNISIGMVYV